MPETPEDIPRLFAEAWNAKDAQALASLFAEDADFVNVVGLWWHNRLEIERAHDYGLRTFFRKSEIVPRRVKVRQMRENMAIVHTRWKLTGQIGKHGEILGDRFALMIFVAERSDDGWHVLAAHNTDVLPSKETNANKDGAIISLDYRD